MFENNSYGQFLKLSLKGASHAKEMSFALENFPSDFQIDVAELSSFMRRRSPGRDEFSTLRKEDDEILFKEGVVQGVTNGSRIIGVIANTDARSKDYGEFRTIPRPGHADFGQWVKFGFIPPGGGANSGRMTALLCAAGGICKQYLQKMGIEISAKIQSIAGQEDSFEESILNAKKEGDSVGGVVRCTITGVKAGLGGALFEGIESAISAGVFAIPGVKGIEFGNGFSSATLKGSENNDSFYVSQGKVSATTNGHGGILGGMSTGQSITFNVAFKPTPTIFVRQVSVDLSTMQNAESLLTGRHDPCIVRRALPVVEAVSAFAMLDMILSSEANIPRICLTLTGKTIEESLNQYKKEYYHIDMVELRADLLDESELESVHQFPSMIDVPAILTCRRVADGGSWSKDEKSRRDFILKVLSAAKAKNFAYVDLESDIQDAEILTAARNADVKIIRSIHDFNNQIHDVAAEAKKIAGNLNDVVKIAIMPNSRKDVEALILAAEKCRNIKHVFCAMGSVGLPSRVLAAKTGSMWTYASLSGLKGIGHLTPMELVRKYRFRAITASTQVVWADKEDVEELNISYSLNDIDKVALPKDMD
jgi:chorismate synthase